MNLSLKALVSFVLDTTGTTPSKICIAMAEHYRAKAIEEPYKKTPYGQAPSGEPCRMADRWYEIALACNKCAEIFVAINI